MKYLFSYILLIFILTGCIPKPYELAVIRIKGSDTMLELTEILAEEYMKIHPGISIYVEGGGTAEGVRALIRGTVDITTASRNLKPEEAKLLGEYYGTVGMVFLVAKDALSIYIHPDNPVKNLTIDNLKQIYLSKLTNWKELGGLDEIIIPVTRNPNSGTYLYFKEHILEGGEYSQTALVESTTKKVIKFVSENRNAIGYGGMGFIGDFYNVKINGIEPSEKNAQNDSYPITRYLHFFTSREPLGAVKNFIDWVLTIDGQRIIHQSGFISLWEVPY